jgi:hypothetical protein
VFDGRFVDVQRPEVLRGQGRAASYPPPRGRRVDGMGTGEAEDLAAVDHGDSTTVATLGR